MCEAQLLPACLQGETKRKAYFPGGMWYNLFDNSTINAGHGGKTVEVELQLGQVGVHTPGGTILPMQQPALLTYEVRASPLTLLLALPQLQPLQPAHLLKPRPTGHHCNTMSALVANARVARYKGMLQSGINSFLATAKAAVSRLLHSLGCGHRLASQAQVEQAAQLAECGVSLPGRATACGQIYMDDGEQLQVSQQ